MADSSNNTIREVTSAGVVTTLAGVSGSAGNTDGTGTGALFASPNDVAVDGAGTLYVADTGNQTIRKITPDGTVTTLAGSAGTAGSTDGTGTAAQFNSPTGVTVDSSGNVYVADTVNHMIRKITSTGVVTTLAGAANSSGTTDGSGTFARFSSPTGVSVDSSGNVYVADDGNRAIRKITPDGTVTTLAGTSGNAGYADGIGAAARFNSPYGLSVDASGNLYVADTGNNAIRAITPGGAVTTLAGTGESTSIGSVDGTGASARFNEPNSVAVDGAGNLYVADLYNSTIRKIAPDGTVTTLAGSAGVPGYNDGVGSAGWFRYPLGVAAASDGTVFVADTYNDTIRKITSDGTVTTLAGIAGAVGSTDAAGSSALFYRPSGVAVDSAGVVYVVDSGNDTIRKIATDGTVSTLAGMAGQAGTADGTGSDARFNNPGDVAVDASGNLYVSDTGNETIRKVTPAGVVTTLAGSPATTGSKDGVGMNAWFFSPLGIAVDGSGNVFVADADNNLIRKVTPAGVVTTLGGLAGVMGSADGTGSVALFNTPSGVAVDAAGNLYVADTFNNSIRKGVVTAGGSTPGGSASGSGGSDSSGSGSSGSGSSGSGSSGSGSSGSSGSSGGSGSGSSGGTSGSGSASFFLYPASVAEDSAGNLYVADASNDVIRKITSAGAVSTLAGSSGVAGMQDGTGSAALFNQPNGVAVDGSGNVYVADTGNAVIRKVAPDGTVSTLAGASGNRGNVDGTGTAAQFNYPLGVAADGAGNVYVADAYTDTIRKVTTAGVVTTLAGRAAMAGDTDGTGTAAQFNYPSGLAVNSAGTVLVADTYNDTIRQITSTGVVTTLAGSAGVPGSNDGTGMYGLFNQPVGVALDGAGNLYVADTGNGMIRKVTPAGVVTTVAGMAGVTGLNDGAGASALFNQPRGLVVDSTGALFVADTGNAVIRRIATDGTVSTLALTAAATGTSGSSSAPTSGSGSATASGGGGGGIMEAWFAGALLFLGMARWMCQKSRRRY